MAIYYYDKDSFERRMYASISSAPEGCNPFGAIFLCIL